MSIYMIGYDLRKTGQDYAALATAIARLGPCWHGLDSTWLVMSNQKAHAIATSLQRHIDSNDRLLVVKLAAESAWIGFEGSNSEWLESYMPRA